MDSQMEGWMKGGDHNIPGAFLKKRGDNYVTRRECYSAQPKRRASFV